MADEKSVAERAQPLASPTPAPAPTQPSEQDDNSDAQSIGGQRNVFTTKQILIAFPALSIALFVSFLDQTSVSTAIPAISADLNTGSATSWIGASFLIAATAFQLINGRLSDIFGRKNLLLICLGLLAGGDLVCGFARTKEQLFAFRAIAGIGGGGVNSVAMIIVSDITTLQNRGKFQGIIGAIIALANGSGPFIGGAVVERATWRWVFWLVPITAVPAGLIILFFLPLKHNSGNHVAKFKMIDYGGILLNLAGCLLILIPLSGGGIAYAWNSAIVISMLAVGGIIWIAFGLWEWKLARVPIMPLRLFGAPHCSYLYAQSFLQGNGFYGNFFYRDSVRIASVIFNQSPANNYSLYFQSALGYSPLESGAIILPLIVTTSLSSIGAGFFMSRFGRYMPCVVAGFAIWSLATGLKCMLDRGTSLGEIIGFLLVEGLGVGLTLQPTLIGLLANSREEDRAVLTGLRNFMRTIGGAAGLTISGAILSNTLSKELSSESFVDAELLKQLSSSTYGLGDMGFSPREEEIVLRAYMRGLHYIFIFYAVSAGAAAVLGLGVGNTDLKSKNKPKDEETRSESETEAGALENTASSRQESGTEVSGMAAKEVKS
ncbi:major facilitator superfamily protein [Sarocladium implicatum]|nr:major facilitator superfamily protein [Sarocladium implicatum]